MNKAFEKILDMLKDTAKIEIQLHCGRCNGKTLALGYTKGIENAIKIVQEVAEEYNGGWIACSERLPNDCDTRFYMCIVENHEEDLPMFCQYEEECGFGFWQDIYDEHTLGFVESIFNTNEELGYEKVIAWQPLPEPFKERD